MARLLNDASSEYLGITSAVLTVEPITMACWMRSDDITLQQCCISIGTSTGASSASFRLEALGSVAGDPIRAGKGSVSADTTTGYTANVWYHACAVFASTTSRTAYINGGSKGTNVTSSGALSSLDRTAIGRRESSAPSLYFSGRLAEVGIWNAVLTDAEVLALAKGVPPWRMRPTNLVGYWPVWGLAAHGTEPDLTVNARDMTITGTVSANHAPVSPRLGMMGRRGTIPVLAVGGSNYVLTAAVGSYNLTGSRVFGGHTVVLDRRRRR